MTKIVNPYIKKAENKQWLLDNYETFVQYMAMHHSLVDCWHTILDLSTFNDAYVEKLIADIELSEKRKEKEEKIRKAKRSGKSVSKIKESSAVDKKIAVMEEAAEKVVQSWDEYGELPD